MAKIVSRHMASQTVMILELELQASSSSFQFQPGQWVDFMAPPCDWIGGFSPASLPSELPNMTLAVKRSRHPPSQWVHSEESKVGQSCQVQAGGTCVLDTASAIHQRQPVVFCAGGIGISPLLSMYRYWNQQLQLQQQQHSNNNDDTSVGKDKTQVPSSSFLYSVSTEEELVFRDILVEEATNAKNLSTAAQQLTITLTQQKAWTLQLKQDLESRGIRCRTGRCMKEFLAAADSAASFYLCGPPAMIDEGIDILQQQRGIPPDQIHYEKWW